MSPFQWLYNKCKSKIIGLLDDTTAALEVGNVKHAAINIIFISLIVAACVFGTYSLIWLVYLNWKILFVWIGIPVIIICLIVAHFEHKNESTGCSSDYSDEDELLRQRAAEVYDFVRDAAYNVIADVSEYTPLIRPASPSAIETNVRIYVREHVAFFQFNSPISDTVDVNDLRERLQTRLTQKLRGRELSGIPSEMVIRNARPYAPLQVYSVSDTGPSVNIDFVFADDTSIPLLEVKARARLERQRQTSYRDTDFK